MKLEIEVLGDPAPQGSKRVYNGRVVEAAGQKLKIWRKAIAAACIEARGDNNVFFTGPVQVRVTFYLPRPKTVTMEKRLHPIVPPDLDKLLRGLLDGIGQSEMVWGDDSQVIDIIAAKRYSDGRDPGAKVIITGI